ncbi:hypothetical protein QZH41_008389, partial [Actinostola sp. cb2023]
NCAYVPDVELLSGQLKRTIDDLQDLALRNQQLLKENQNLGMKLGQASTDLDLKHRRLEVLEKQMTESERGVLEAHSNANRLNEAVAQQLRTLQQGIFERNTYIIALQMKLLATEEEIKETKKTQEELRSQNEMLSSKWQELSKDYDYERRESMKLSAKLKSQQGNLQKAGQFERKCREFKHINQKMMVERDESIYELEDLKDWTEALKARYDLIVEEYNQLQQSFVSGATENCKLKEEIEELRLQLSLSKIGVGDLKGWNEDLEETVKNYREQRDLFSESRNAALLERDEFRKERDEAAQYHNELMADRDEMIDKQTEHAKHFEQKYEKACTEMKALRERISNAEIELQELRIQRSNQNQYESQTSETNNMQGNIEQRLGSFFSQESSTTSQNGDIGLVPFSQIEGFPWKNRRGAKEIVQSLRKRVTGQHHKAVSLDRSLDKLKVDGCETLSQEARTSLTLHGDNLLFKTPPTYNTLRVMFGLSVGGHKDSFTDVSGAGGASGTSPKDSSGDTCTSTSSTDGMSQDEALGAFEKATEFDVLSSTSPHTGTETTKIRNTPQLRRTYTKSRSEPNLNVKSTNLDVSASHEEQHGEDESEISQSKEDGNDEPDGGDFHWVREDECLPKRDGFLLMSGKTSASDAKSKEEIEQLFKSLSRARPPFRQRAWAMKKKKERRSSSAPTIILPEHENIVETPSKENADSQTGCIVKDIEPCEPQSSISVKLTLI